MAGANAGGGGETCVIVGAGDIGLGVAVAAAGDGRYGRVYTVNRSGRRPEGSHATIVSLVADITDEAEIGRVVGGMDADVVFFTTSPGGRTEDAYRAAYIDGVGNVLACMGSVGRVVLTSSTGVYGADDGSFVDETTQPAPVTPTAKVLLAAEEAVLERCADAVVVRPGGIYGPGRSLYLARSVARGEKGVRAAGSADVRWTNRIHREDLVAALMLVAHHPSPPPVVVAVDGDAVAADDVTWWMVERLAGAPPPPVEARSGVSGKRCSAALLRSLGWLPRFPSFVEGYDPILPPTADEM